MRNPQRQPPAPLSSPNSNPGLFSKVGAALKAAPPYFQSIADRLAGAAGGVAPMEAGTPTARGCASTVAIPVAAAAPALSTPESGPPVSNDGNGVGQTTRLLRRWNRLRSIFGRRKRRVSIWFGRTGWRGRL